MVNYLLKPSFTILTMSKCRHTGTILLKIVYGYDTMEGKDPMIALVHQGIACLEEATSPGQAIEMFPWCGCLNVQTCEIFPLTDRVSHVLVRYIPSWFPFAGFKRSALKWREDYARMREIPFEYAATNMVCTPPPNLLCILNPEAEKRRLEYQFHLQMAQQNSIS